MPVQKAISSNPYNSSDPYGHVNPPTLEDEAGSGFAYESSFSFQISKIFTMAGLPAASTMSNLLVYIVDAPNDQKLQWSDGTTWINLLPLSG